MLKKVISVMLAVVFAAMLAGCSDYVMTERDLAIQKSIEGYWSAGSATGYNAYDEDGNITALMVVEFTDDFRYFIHECYINDGYVITYDPISYSFEDEKFRVDVEGVASYAGVSVSDDGQTMYWITDSRTDPYDRLTVEEARAYGIPEYDKERWDAERAESSED